MSLDILLTSLGNPGNLTPFLTAARLLAQRGHRVRFIDFASSQEEIRNAGFDGACWRRPAALVPPTPGCDDYAALEFRCMMEQMTFGSAYDYAADVIESINTQRADVIVTHDLLAGPALAAEACGIPYALLAPHVSIRPIDGVPAGASGLCPSESPEDEVREEAAYTRLVAMMNGCLPALNRARVQLGLPRLSHVLEHYDRADRLLIGLSRAFDFPARRLPDNLRYVGPLLDTPAWSKPWSPPWSKDCDRPRVLVSLSTSFQNQAGLIRRIITALGGMPVDAVVTVGPAMADADIQATDNVTLLHSAPHDTVMREVSVVVTHGGHGTVTRALLSGRPLLVLPMGRDQADNAARVVARGAGLRLASEAGVDEIASALARLVYEPNFHAAAARLGRLMTPDVNASILATEVEALGRRQQRRSA